MLVKYINAYQGLLAMVSIPMSYSMGFICGFISKFINSKKFSLRECLTFACESGTHNYFPHPLLIFYGLFILSVPLTTNVQLQKMIHGNNSQLRRRLDMMYKLVVMYYVVRTLYSLTTCLYRSIRMRSTAPLKTESVMTVSSAAVVAGLLAGPYISEKYGLDI